MAVERATDNTERAKAVGDTPAQKEMRSYHKGKFQTHDPVTGEKRDAPLPELVDDAIQLSEAEEAEAADVATSKPRKAKRGR